jgi:hypothetical protein
MKTYLVAHPEELRGLELEELLGGVSGGGGGGRGRSSSSRGGSGFLGRRHDGGGEKRGSEGTVVGSLFSEAIREGDLSRLTSKQNRSGKKEVVVGEKEKREGRKMGGMGDTCEEVMGE